MQVITRSVQLLGINYRRNTARKTGITLIIYYYLLYIASKDTEPKFYLLLCMGVELGLSHFQNTD